ncbi:MAG: NHL repeat-containing protein [Candidatus Omnitrophota bacterium]
MRNRLLFPAILGMLLLFLGNAPSAFGQETAIGFNQQVNGTLTPAAPSATYTFQGTRGVLVEALLDLAEWDFSLRLTLLDVRNQPIFVNEGLNDLDFAGAYMIQTIPNTATYKFRIEFIGLTEPVDYTFRIQVLGADEADRNIQIGESKSGYIASMTDQDIFNVYLRKDTPVFFLVRAPYGILDSVMGVFDPTGNLAAMNDDYFTSASMILYNPPVTGTYMVLIQGSTEDAIGPYELAVKNVPLYSPPFELTEKTALPGDVFVYEMLLFEDRVYMFTATGVDGFVPIAALTDANMGVLSSSSPTEGYDYVAIPGFTPIREESLFFIVAGETPRQSGALGVETSLMEDEEDGAVLEHGIYLSGVIGPIGDADEYVFTAEEGKTYSILVTPTWHYLDPAVRVLDSAGNEVYFNDNSADGQFALLSGIQLASGVYRVQAFASPTQEYLQQLTGVYIIQFAEGTTFDRGEPRIFEPWIDVSPAAAGVHISIPTAAILDDTYPLSATMTFESGLPDFVFAIQKGQPVEIDLPAKPDDIFFMTITDSAYTKNTAMDITLPPPRIVAAHRGMMYALAVDKDNALYFTDSQTGSVIKADISGATKTLVVGEATGGGTLGPNALAFDHNGDLYLSNARTYSVMKISPDGATQTVVSDLNFPVDIAFDKDNNLIVAQIGSDTVDRIRPDGTRETLVSSIRNPNGLAFAPDGMLYICNADKGNSGIYRLLLNGTLETFMEPFTDSLEGMAFDQDGNLYAADGMAGFVYRIDPNKNFVVFTRWMSGPVDLAFGRGEYAKTLFATNMGIEAAGYYMQTLIAIPTGHAGMLLPYGSVGILDWRMWEGKE